LNQERKFEGICGEKNGGKKKKKSTPNFLLPSTQFDPPFFIFQ
jgi:hypothetical protein